MCCQENFSRTKVSYFVNLFIIALSINSREQQSQQILISNNSSSNNSIRSPKRPPLPAALRTVTSPQRALQMPAFTSLQHLNLQQNPSTTTPCYNPNAFQTVHSNNDNIPSWICSVCTFQNHPLLNKCEQCEEPRNPSGTIQITAAHFAPRFENVQYQKQAHTNHDYANARSFSLTNNPSAKDNNPNPNNDIMVPQTAPPSNSNPFFDVFGRNNSNTKIISSLEELQYENVTQGDLTEHTYVNVSSVSVGNIPGIFKNQIQAKNKTDEEKKVFVKGHKYRPSM